MYSMFNVGFVRGFYVQCRCLVCSWVLCSVWGLFMCSMFSVGFVHGFIMFSVGFVHVFYVQCMVYSCILC